MGKATREDVRIAEAVSAGYDRIRELRKQINEEFLNIKELVEQDGQPIWEVQDVEKMRITHNMVLNYELLHAAGNWESWADYRRRDLK